MFYYSPFWAYWTNQTISGTAGRDWLFGGFGHDRIWSGAGADFVWGGFGHDLIWAGEGNDTLLGGWGADTLYGEGGNDRLYGGSGHDVLFAGDGRDTVVGGWGHDQIFLGDDDDVAWGGAGRDVIYVGTGNDRVYGGWGFDTVVAEGSIRNYNLIHNGDGSVTLQHLAYNSDVIDQNWLRGVELIKFKDGSYYLDGRNNGPRAKNDHTETGDSGALILQEAQLLENDVDWDGDVLSVVSVSATSDKGGTVTLADGQITYVPAPEFAALGVGQSTTDRFYYTIDDGRGGQATASFWLTISGSNDAPTLAPGVLAASEDGARVDLDLSTLGADVDSEDDGSTLSYELLSHPSEGTVTVTGHTLSFTPGDGFQDLAQGETRDVTVQIRATDAQGAQAVNSVTVTVTGQNDDPTLAPGVLTASEDGARVDLDLSTLGADVDSEDDGSTLSYELLSHPSEGTVTVTGHTLSFTPGDGFQDLAQGETRDVTVQIRATDAQGAQAVNSVTVTVAGSNDAPVISGPVRVSVDENTGGQVARFTATDAEGQAITYSLSGDDAARFTIAADGALTLIQPADYEAPSDADGDNVYSLTVQATDAQGRSDTQDLAVTVNDVPEYSLVVSEIMYNPASQGSDWEWVEIVNTGDAPVDLSGWVFDANSSAAQSGANIVSGQIPSGGSAILYNADAISAEDFAAAWGTGINLIGVTGWDRASLNDSGDTIGLWSSFEAYQGDHATHANAVLSLTYDNTNGWPVDDGAGSIYLKDLSADASDGTNWALSSAGGDTPVNTGETSLADGGNSGADVGSPGGLTPVGDVKISEFRPNPSGADPATTQVELSGNAGAVFSGYLVAIESGSSGAGAVTQAFAVSGTFDANGLLSVTVPDFTKPSMTLVLTDSFDLANVGAVDIDTDDDGMVDDQSAFGKIYDAIGVPGSAGDQSTLYGAALGGTDFVSTGDEPQLIFRDGTSGDLYAVNDPVGDKIFGADGTQRDLDDFDRDPTQGSFGTENPSYVPPLLTLSINEVLADPASGDAGDANGDGTRDAAQDEFVEILNTGDAPVDLSGVTLSDGVAVRHVFAPGTTLEAGKAIVVFGGGTPTGAFGGAQVVTASSGALGLNDGGDSVILTQPGNIETDRLDYGAEGNSDESLTRSPEGTGAFVQHETVSDASYSPGTQANGLAFGSTTSSSASISINEIRHGQRSVDKDEFIELFTSNPATSLKGMTLIALSGEGDAGRVSMALDLSAGSFDADGVFMIADSRITTGSFDAGDISVSGGLNLGSQPTTYMLVNNFTGALGDDLDTDDDGTLDVQPWLSQLDALAFRNGDDIPDILYSDVTVAANSAFTASGAVAKGDGSDNFEILDFRDLSKDSPGSLNGGGISPSPSKAQGLRDASSDSIVFAKTDLNTDDAANMADAVNISDTTAIQRDPMVIEADKPLFPEDQDPLQIGLNVSDDPLGG